MEDDKILEKYCIEHGISNLYKNIAKDTYVMLYINYNIV